MSKIYEKLKKELTVLEKDYEKNGTILWKDFEIDPLKHQKKIVIVSQNDFNEGTLRITHPCLIRFKENISFNPNRPKTWIKNPETQEKTSNFEEACGIDPDRKLDWFPSPLVPSNMKRYLQGDQRHAYNLGFFAALTIDAKGVIIDLNGFTLKQHKEHALMQRFFALIELADQPFIMGQGPGDFGHSLKSGRKIWIKNGVLGLASHHGIHGNGANEILISDIKFKDFEVAAISINGSNDVAVAHCHIMNNRQDIPILGTFSAARFNTLFAQMLIQKQMTSPGLLKAYEELKKSIEHMFNDIIFGFEYKGELVKGFINLNPHLKNKTQQCGKSSHIIFYNHRRTIDGPAYGILNTTHGVAVGPYLENNMIQDNRPCGFEVLCCKIENLKANIIEIPSLSNANGTGNQVDIAGAVIQYLTNIYKHGVRNHYGKYQGTVLSNLQMELQALKNQTPEEYHKYFGTLNIDQKLVDWALKDEGYLDFVPHQNKMRLRHCGTSYDIRYQGDSMHHVLKGLIAIRIEGVRNILLQDIDLNNVINTSHLSHPYAPYSGPHDGGHEGQSNMKGYFGAETRGISAACVDNLKIKRINMSNIISHFGSSTGIFIQNDSRDLKLSEIWIRDIHAGQKLYGITNKMPNKPQESTGILVEKTCRFLNKLVNIDVDKLSEPKPGQPVKIDIRIQPTPNPQP